MTKTQDYVMRLNANDLSNWFLWRVDADGNRIFVQSGRCFNPRSSAISWARKDAGPGVAIYIVPEAPITR